VPLVSVVVPAFNAAATIDRTLASIRAQTHRQLEIIVVDDGSIDPTASHVLAHAADDPRIRLFRQANGGVAAARNRGIAESRSEFIAPIDADDLWHPDKIARQVAMLQCIPELGLVATAYTVIDPSDRIIADVGGTLPATVQLQDLCRRNFIGNGSSAMMRRALVEQLGGYDPTLRARGGQGCEDLKLYLGIAEVAEIGFIREPLTAYRRGPANMSRDAREMLRSFDLVAEDLSRRRPDLRRHLKAHRVYMLSWLIGGALRSGQAREVAWLAEHLLTTSSLALPGAVAGVAARRVVKTARRLATGRERRPMLNWAITPNRG
jgi:glycosyltransferase involved in cell wall biosynthesis